MSELSKKIRAAMAQASPQPWAFDNLSGLCDAQGEPLLGQCGAGAGGAFINGDDQDAAMNAVNSALDLCDEIDLLESKLEAVCHMAANVDFEQKMEPDEVIEARVYGARWIAEFMGSERFGRMARSFLERRRTEGA